MDITLLYVLIIPLECTGPHLTVQAMGTREASARRALLLEAGRSAVLGLSRDTRSHGRTCIPSAEQLCACRHAALLG